MLRSLQTLFDIVILRYFQISANFVLTVIQQYVEISEHVLT